MTKEERRKTKGILKDKSKRNGPFCYCGFHHGRERLHLKNANSTKVRIAFANLKEKIMSGFLDIEDVVWTENPDNYTDKWDVC